MKAEILSAVEEIKKSLALLKRHPLLDRRAKRRRESNKPIIKDAMELP